MAKLGFWNRLALVLTVLATLLSPIVAALYVANEHDRINDIFYKLCRERLPDFDDPTYNAESKRCWAEYTAPYNGPDADFFWEVAWGALAICVGLYVLIWSISAVCRWIWAGRKNSSHIAK